jgi:hypothetical protein
MLVAGRRTKGPYDRAGAKEEKRLKRGYCHQHA